LDLVERPHERQHGRQDILQHIRDRYVGLVKQLAAVDKSSEIRKEEDTFFSMQLAPSSLINNSNIKKKKKKKKTSINKV
jgi:hypothetical protein